MSGEDWLLGDVGKKPGKPKKLERAPSPPELDQVEQLLDDVAGDGKRLVAGVNSAVAALEAMKKSGLTGEALVVLVTEKCAWAKNGKRVSPETVQLVLEALFRLGEYVR